MKCSAAQLARSRPSRTPASRPYAAAALAALLSWCLTLSAAAVAQSGTPNVQHTKNTPDLGLRARLKVDPSTLAMSIQIPLGDYPGRAGLGRPLALYYNSKVWRIEFNSFVNGAQSGCGGDPDIAVGAECYTTTRARFAEHSVAGWTFSAMPAIEFDAERYDSAGQPLGHPTQGYYIPRMTVRFADGSTHELRRGDAALSGADPMTGTYHAVDSSRLKYVGVSPGAGTLHLPDGSRYDVSGYAATRLVDSNGNVLTVQDALGRQVQDTLGRQLTAPSFHADSAHAETHSLPGVGGAQMNYTFDVRELDDPGVLEPDMLTGAVPSPRRVGDMHEFGNEVYADSLFASTPEGRVIDPTAFNPRVLHRIVLPDGTAYTFTYNEYGEIARVAYPAGGYERYRYAHVTPLAHVTAPYSQANRGVVERRVSAGGTAGEVTWRYSPGETIAPDGTRTVRRLHAGYSFGTVVFGFDDPRAGMAYDERVYAPESQGGAMLRRTLTEWDASGPQAGGHASAKRDPKVLRTVEMLLDTGSGSPLAKSTTYLYGQASQPLNVTAVTEHEFVAVARATAEGGQIGDVPAGDAVRTTETAYKDEAAYHERNLVALPVSATVRAGGPEGGPNPGAVVARTKTYYDEQDYYGGDMSLLACGATEGREEATPAARGNVTTVGRWLDALGAADDPSAYLDTHTRYDRCGSARQAWDAARRGALSPRVSGVEYAADYQYAYPTRTASAVPDPSGQYGSTAPLVTAAAYDPSTGLVTSTTDANGVVTSFAYADPFNRLTRTVHAVGTAAQAQTTVSYDDANRTVTTTSDQVTYDDNRIKGVTVYDGLGRAVETRQHETSTSYISSALRYDALGRVYLASRPSRGQGATTDGWVRTSYDALSRVTEVSTFAGAAQPPATGTDASWTGSVTTSYVGNAVTVTDQRGRKRRSVTDALGRLARVDEPDAGGGGLDDAAGDPVQPTHYAYDVLGNLRQVTQSAAGQGTQTRTFVYDSLGRLTSATNPESGAVSYTYDANGNLRTKTDARGTTATYGYDALNRNVTVTYAAAGGAAATPSVTRHYDNPAAGAYGLGRPWKSEAAQTALTTAGPYDPAGRPTAQSQQFWSGGAWGQPFTTRLTYDLAGGVTSQAYPSGHAVSYNYDAAGRPADRATASGMAPAFSGNLGDGLQRTYSSEVLYDQSGGMSQERLGTDTALYHKRLYNSRGQLAELRVGFYPVTDPDRDRSRSWQRGAIINHYGNAGWGEGSAGPYNNGNLRQQDVFIPNDDAAGYEGRASVFAQTYGYDHLNRLASAAESGGASWRQGYAYDRWGNRRVDASATQNAPAPQFSADAATNRLSPPSGYAMRYDASGNLTYDDYTGAGGRAYDAENRMTWAQAGGGQAAAYAYDADGRRVKRNTGAGEVWQVYGLGGELLAEYAAGSPPSSPREEYGYRGGELLVTAEMNAGGWGPPPSFAGPDPLRRGDPILLEHLTDLRGAVNQLRQHAGLAPYNFTADPEPVRRVTKVKAEHVRQLRAALGEARARLGLSVGGYAHPTLTEGVSPIYAEDFQELRDQVRGAWRSDAGGADIRWLVADQLGTPRMVVDKTGTLAGVTRHDYLPFGEEIGAGTGGRTTNQGYNQVDNVRQKFTGYERDDETGLDYAQARYYSSAQGRFTSPDNFLNDTSAVDPASWNLYAYVRNNPLRYTDPSGEKIYVGGLSQDDRDELLKRANYTYGCQSCVSVDKNGYLAVDTSGLSKDVLKATQFLTDAINTTSWYGEVRVSNNDSNVAFGEGRRRQGSAPFEDGSGRRRNADLIVLDFGDDQWVSGDSRARDAFLNTVFAHEVAHFRLQPGAITRDPDDIGKTGPVVDAVNEILQARGLSLRARYYSSARGGHWLEIYHGIAERDRAGNIMRNQGGGIRVKINETGNVIRWLKRNVGGKGIN